MDPEILAGADNEHQESIDSLGDDARRALSIAFSSVAHVAHPLAMTNIPENALFANAAAALACFSLAHQHLRMCLLAVTFGYYESLGSNLRSAYEAAGCGQYLSREPDAAEKWIRRSSSWPRDEVRSRLGDVTRGSAYGRFYGVVSARAHPTAKASMGLVELEDGVATSRLARRAADEDELRGAALWIAGTAVFTCFAIRNANPAGATEPRWLEGVKQIAEDLSRMTGAGSDFSHLEQDWVQGQERWERIVDKLRPSHELDRAMDEEPSSWLRASREAGLDSKS